MQTVNFLSQTRFKPRANDVFKMSVDDFNKIDDYSSSAFLEIVNDYISEFKQQQLSRLEELKRYYKAENNIKLRPNKKDKYRADNRIAHDWAKNITVFMQGYMLGNPISYETDDESLREKIQTFSQQNTADYHDGLIETDLSIYGRAYELIYSDGEANERVVKLEPENTFVVYDDTMAENSLFGVRFYTLRYNDSITKAFIEVYTDENVYYYNSESDTFAFAKFNREIEHHYGAVPINEYKNNEERMGDFESVLDIIDAYDASESELANFQQDMNDAYLVLKGNPNTGNATQRYKIDGEGNYVVDEFGEKIPEENSDIDVIEQMKEARLLVLDNNSDPNGVNPDAFYLTKQYDSTGAEAYKKRLVDDILRFTFTPDTNDQNFAGTQSGEAMKYKLMGNDNLRKTKERLMIKGIMRRLRLLGNVWSIKNSVSGGNLKSIYNLVNEVKIKFTPNIPQNDEERVSQLKQLYGVISDETLLTLLSIFTGVDAETEMKRLADEKQREADDFNSKTGYTQLADDDGGVDE